MTNKETIQSVRDAIQHTRMRDGISERYFPITLDLRLVERLCQIAEDAQAQNLLTLACLDAQQRYFKEADKVQKSVLLKECVQLEKRVREGATEREEGLFGGEEIG